VSPSLLGLFHRGATVLLLHALIAFWRLRIAFNQWRLARIKRRSAQLDFFSLPRM